jgi:hypothetical protein
MPYAIIGPGVAPALSSLVVLKLGGKGCVLNFDVLHLFLFGLEVLDACLDAHQDLLGILELLLLDAVVLIELMFQVIEIPVLFDIELIESLELGLEPLVLLHEGRLDVDEALIPLFSPLQLGSLLLNLVLQILLLALHIGHVLGQFGSALILLLDDLLHASFDIGLVVGAVRTAAHAVQEVQGILPVLPQVRFPRQRVVQFGSQLTNLVCQDLVGFQVRNFCWQ